MKNINTLKSLADQLGMTVPETLSNLVNSGAASYPDGFNKDLVNILTTMPPALASAYDFEWLEDQEDYEANITEWLAPEHQFGNLFLPFAQSGAGDIYAIIRLKNGQEGCGLILHDDDTSMVDFTNFDDFLYAHFLDTMLNMKHLEYDLNPQQAVACLRADFYQTCKSMTSDRLMLLKPLIERDPELREFKYGPKSKPIQVLSLISDAEHTHYYSQLNTSDVKFDVVARWEIRSAT